MPSPALLLALILITPIILFSAAEKFTIATWNLENYLDQPTTKRRSKPIAAKTNVHATLLELRADVIALQEMGSTNALSELRNALKRSGLDYPHWEHVHARDDEIHLAVLSRFPIAARRPHTNESFLIDGRRFFVKRGFAEVDIRVGTNYHFTLLAAHLKSKLQVAGADESSLRLNEARLLRRRVDAILSAKAESNLVVLGDFNDTEDSPPLKLILGRDSGRGLLDTCPRELGVLASPPNGKDNAWTYHYDRQKSFSRFDYILLSSGMKREWQQEGTRIFSRNDWRIASDHRPLVATFSAEDR